MFITHAQYRILLHLPFQSVINYSNYLSIPISSRAAENKAFLFPITRLWVLKNRLGENNKSSNPFCSNGCGYGNGDSLQSANVPCDEDKN
ncbi:hypothetical protein TNCT_417451 [Trichonephila clavata]|uniref:Uncharacterized protein n=1 Tax=Trichonephila clavata TaxID=2740835 RepID=A0A8X6LLE7_TRICU|nr:hypothetical protein TNCT_417451 [Trichonephila clavata]